MAEPADKKETKQLTPGCTVRERIAPYVAALKSGSLLTQITRRALLESTSLPERRERRYATRLARSIQSPTEFIDLLGEGLREPAQEVFAEKLLERVHEVKKAIFALRNASRMQGKADPQLSESLESVDALVCQINQLLADSKVTSSEAHSKLRTARQILRNL